ncbi:MAG: MBOAT family O-acyltransferase [Gammaproteobacteria bacterium]
MLFNSPEFIFLFLPIALIGFFTLGGRGYFTLAIAWLVLASLFFYGWWKPVYLALIISSIVVNYLIGVQLGTRSRAGKPTRWVLAVGIAFNLGLLGYFKYANFFVDTLNDIELTQLHLQTIVLPLAISFFTFQQIAYLVDAWKGEAREYDFLRYGLFVTFFPQLIAGPIVHHKEVLPQFMRQGTGHFSHADLAVGLSIFFIGLFKKVVIADNLAPLATPIFQAAENGDALHFFESLQAITAYTFQLYFDFSGYSDMAIGLARMFGIRLPLNFNSPYQAVNIIDFWRRWHMTLSRFLRDYLYIPLGGSRRGKTRRYINLMATMLLGGLWHGAGWTFVFWGFLHGAYLVINHMWHRVWRRPINTWWSIGLARLVTLMAVMVAWVFFRAESFGGAMNVFEGLTHLPANLHAKLGPLAGVLDFMGFEFNGPWTSGRDLKVLALLFGMTAIVWFVPNTQQLFARYRPALGYNGSMARPAFLQTWSHRWYWRPNVAWSLGIASAGTLSLLGLTQVSEFIYYNF